MISKTIGFRGFANIFRQTHPAGSQLPCSSAPGLEKAIAALHAVVVQLLSARQPGQTHTDYVWNPRYNAKIAWIYHISKHEKTYMEKWKPKNEWPLWVQLMFNTKVTLHCQYAKCSSCTKMLIQVNSFRNLNQITWLEPLLLRPFEFEQRLEAKQLAAQPTADPSCTIQTSEGNLLHAQSIEYFQTQKSTKNDPSYKRDLLTKMRKKWSNPPFSSIKSIKSLPVISTGWDKLRLSAVLLSVALLVKVPPPGRDDQPSGSFRFGTNLGQ